MIWGPVYGPTLRLEEEEFLVCDTTLSAYRSILVQYCLFIIVKVWNGTLLWPNPSHQILPGDPTRPGSVAFFLKKSVSSRPYPSPPRRRVRPWGNSDRVRRRLQGLPGHSLDRPLLILKRRDESRGAREISFDCFPLLDVEFTTNLCGKTVTSLFFVQLLLFIFDSFVNFYFTFSSKNGTSESLLSNPTGGSVVKEVSTIHRTQTQGWTRPSVTVWSVSPTKEV